MRVGCVGSVVVQNVAIKLQSEDISFKKSSSIYAMLWCVVVIVDYAGHVTKSVSSL